MRKPQKPNPEYLERLEVVKGFIVEYWERHHYSPSTNEMADYFQASTSVVSYWLDRLERDGWIEMREAGVARNIVPVEIFKERPVFPEKEAKIYDTGL